MLRDRMVIGVSGTHGKTTTNELPRVILEIRWPPGGFLIGGGTSGFRVFSAPWTDGVVIEADEYDTAFFDKRAKFSCTVHKP